MIFLSAKSSMDISRGLKIYVDADFAGAKETSLDPNSVLSQS